MGGRISWIEGHVPAKNLLINHLNANSHSFVIENNH